MLIGVGCAGFVGSYGVSPVESARRLLIAVVKPGVSPAASAASATMRCISRADSMVREPYLVLLRKSTRTSDRYESALASMGSFNLMLFFLVIESAVTGTCPPVGQPDTVQGGPAYTGPMRISRRSLTSKPISVVTVGWLYAKRNLQSGLLAAASASAALASATAAGSFTSGFAGGPEGVAGCGNRAHTAFACRARARAAVRVRSRCLALIA